MYVDTRAHVVIGRCSLCDGDVYQQQWPASAKCAKCGAEEDRLPVIKMRKIGGGK